MKSPKNISLCADGAAFAMGLVAGCSGGDDNLSNDGVTLAWADGEVVQQLTCEQAIAASATHGGGATDAISNSIASTWQPKTARIARTVFPF